MNYWDASSFSGQGFPSWQSSFSYQPSSSITSGASGSSFGGGMLPAVAGIASAGASLLSGIFSNRTQASAAQAQINAGRDAAIAANIWNEAFRQDRANELTARLRQQDVANLMSYQLGAGQLQLGEAGLRSQDFGRQLQYQLGEQELLGRLGSDIGARTAQFGWGADLGFERGMKEREFELGRGAEKETAIMSDRSRRERLARISPETQRAQRFEEELNRRRIAAGQIAGPTAMFGPTAFSSRVFG